MHIYIYVYNTYVTYIHMYIYMYMYTYIHTYICCRERFRWGEGVLHRPAEPHVAEGPAALVLRRVQDRTCVYMYIYIYGERERGRDYYIHIYIYIYMYT